MYGLILENIVDFIKRKYGAGTWQEIQYVAGIQESAFDNYIQYSEGLAARIIWAAQDVTGKNTEDLLEIIGESFYDFISQFEYDKILRVLGRTFTEFLNGLDNLHEYIRFSYPVLKPPSFYCEHESKTGLTLHYRSKRNGFVRYVMGQIKKMGKVLYDQELRIEIVDKEIDENSNHHVIMRLHFNNLDYDVQRQRGMQDDLVHQVLSVSSELLFEIFPFIIVFNRGMQIRNVGMGLTRVMKNLVGEKVNQEFIIIRPLVSFRWEDIMLYSNNQFEIMSLKPVVDDGRPFHITGETKEIESERRRLPPEEKMKFLSLKGQMLYMEEWESICFLGIPVMDNLEQMFKTGLYINDFALHDSSRDLVLASTQQQAEIRLLQDQEKRKKQILEDSIMRLEAERQRTDEIMYSAMPRMIGDKLRNGMDALTTCESFESVTLIVVDIVGFTSLCNSLEPDDVIGLLNDLHGRFDDLLDAHSLSKVEVIGDAYMAMGGAPQRSRYHAEYACDCALAMLRIAIDVFDGSKGGGGAAAGLKGKKIRVQLGIHTGPVSTGVVGLRIPRYCAFGETVTIAKMMEATGQPMKIQVADFTRRHCLEVAPNLFKFVSFAYFEFSGSQMKTYWLEDKFGPARDPHNEKGTLG